MKQQTAMDSDAAIASRLERLGWRQSPGILGSNSASPQSIHALLGYFLNDRHSPTPFPGRDLLVDHKLYNWGVAPPLPTTCATNITSGCVHNGRFVSVSSTNRVSGAVTTMHNDTGNDPIGEQLDQRGFADLGKVLEPDKASEIAACYESSDLFRSRVVMRRHNFGEGEYQYFDYPLPETVAHLRRRLYEQLLPTANRWQEQLKTGVEYPATLDGMLQRCHEAGQSRPTPLLLRYEAHGYNCLHQDLYGELAFPLQVVVLLTPGDAFTGGELVLTEQRPRMQSRATVVPLTQGRAIAFAVNERPRRGTRGFYRVKHRHGVSDIRSGQRMTLGIIFHDAA